MVYVPPARQDLPDFSSPHEVLSYIGRDLGSQKKDPSFNAYRGAARFRALVMGPCRWGQDYAVINRKDLVEKLKEGKLATSNVDAGRIIDGLSKYSSRFSKDDYIRCEGPRGRRMIFALATTSNGGSMDTIYSVFISPGRQN